MSSSYFRLIGKLKDNRSLIKEIVRRLGKLEQQANSLDTIDFRHYLRANNDRILYIGTFTTELAATVIDPNLKNYQMPLEPDGQYLTAWLKFLHISGSTIIDSSGFENNANIIGSPTPQSGPYSGLPAYLFDGIDDRLAVPNTGYINTSGIITGISISFNIYPALLSLHNGTPRMIAGKTDDDISVRDQGWQIWIEPDGTLYFHVRFAGLDFTASKTGAIIAVNQWYRVVCTFDRLTNTPKIYVNGNVSTDPVTTYVGASEMPSVSNDMTVGGDDVAGRGHWSGLISDFRYWREKVLTATEIANWIRNGYSISNIDYIARAGVGAFPPAEGGGGSTPPPVNPPPTTMTKSFTATSFTTTSFTV